MESSSFPGDRDAMSWPAGGPRGDGGTDHRPTEINALLGRGTHFEGNLFFEGRVRINGSYRGEIRGDDVLVIGEGALVIGEIHVATCIVTGGEVQAGIRARDAIELYAPSKVTGALHAPAIFIDRGVQFDGSCKMAPLDEAIPEGAADRLGSAEAGAADRLGSAEAGAADRFGSAEAGAADRFGSAEAGAADRSLQIPERDEHDDAPTAVQLAPEGGEPHA